MPSHAVVLLQYSKANLMGLVNRNVKINRTTENHVEAFVLIERLVPRHQFKWQQETRTNNHTLALSNEASWEI